MAQGGIDMDKWVSIQSMNGNAACNVYAIDSSDPYWVKSVIRALNSVNVTTIFNDVGAAVYALRTYPFDIEYKWYANYRPDGTPAYEDIRIYNTDIAASAYPIKRQICFRHAVFDCRYGSVAYQQLKNARTFGGAQIYLPYIGFVPLDLTNLYNHRLVVYYSIDLATGECGVALEIEPELTTIAIVNGRIGEDSMFANSNAAQVFRQNLVTGTSAAVGSATQFEFGNYVGAVGTAVKGVGDMIMNNITSTNRGQIGSSNVGRNGPQTAYILIECYDPNENLTEFSEMRGRPLERVMHISNLSGYTEFSDVHLYTPNALKDEKDELESMLKSGVIL